MTKPKLLIIDDEVEYAATLRQRLCLRDFDVEEVYSGTEGLARLIEKEPDIVILDLKMPDMNGLDVLAGIKKYDKSIEVIMVTGHGSTASGMKAMEKGAFDYIMKPFNLNCLLDKIQLAYEKKEKG